MNEVDTLLRLAEQAGIHDDPLLQLLLRTANRSPSNCLAEKAQQSARNRILRQFQYPFTEETPRVSSFTPKIYLGKTQRYSRPYYLPLEELTGHQLTIGITGAGKTTLHFNTIDQLLVPFWVFDLKQDYRHLIRQRDDILVLPHEILRFNPLEPPLGVEDEIWAATFAEIFCGTFDLLEGSSSFLRPLLKELYQDKDEPPTLFELERRVNEPGINFVLPVAKFQNRITWRIKGLRSDTHKITNCRKGYPIHNLLKRNVIFEFDGLPTTTQNFLMEILLAWIYCYRKEQNQRGGQLRHVTILDESHTIFSWYKEQQLAAGIPEIDKLIKLMREFGEGLIAADQEASKLTDSIKSNTKTKVLLATGDHREFQAITESMKLTPLQKEWAKTLDTGQAIIQNGDNEPVPIQLQDTEIKKDVSDSEIEKAMRTKWKQLPYQPVKHPFSTNKKSQKTLDGFLS